MLDNLRETLLDFNHRHTSALMAVVLVLLIAVVACLALYFTNRQFFCPKPSTKNGFTNVGPGGYSYDTSSMKFESAQDRNLAIKLLSTSLQKDNITYSIQQLSNLPDPFVIMALEPEDKDDEIRLKARVVVMVDPDYQLAIAASQKARKNKNVLATESERVVIYNLLVRYFSAIKQPLGVKLPYWPDYLLIQTLRSLQTPPSNAFSSSTYTKGGPAVSGDSSDEALTAAQNCQSAIQLADESTRAIGLYFSASYCKWCTEFTPKLKSIYPDLKKLGIDIVLVGSDKSPESYVAYSSDHPWSVVPYVHQDRSQLREKFAIKTIPALIFLNRDGTPINLQGRSLVTSEYETSVDTRAISQQIAHQLGISTMPVIDSNVDYDSDNSDF